MTALSRREILFVLKMQNEARGAISEFTGEVQKAAAAMKAVETATGRTSKQRGPTEVTKELIKAQQEAAKTVQRLIDIETIIRDLNGKNLDLFAGTPYGEALKVFKDSGATREDIEAGSAKEVNVLMEYRRRALEAVEQGYNEMGDAANAAGRKASDSARRANDELDEHAMRVNGAAKAWRAAKIAIAATAAFLGGNKIIREADAWKNLTGQLKLVTDGEENLAAVRERVLEISKRTYTDLGATASLYTKLAQRADQLGKSQEEVAQLVENVSMAMQVGGSTAEEAAAATRQFAQAISAGKLSGDELNSIIENAPGLAMAFEQGLRDAGKEVRSLKQYIQDAKPTIGELLDALESQGPRIKEQFEQLPLTVGQGMTYLATSVTEFIGKVDQASQATDGIATFLVRLGNIITSDGFIDFFAGIATVIGGALNAALTAVTATMEFFRNNTWAAATAVAALTMYLTSAALAKAPELFRAIATAAGQAATATRAWTAALLANPLTAILVVIAGIVSALYVFRDAIKFSGDEAYTLGEVATGAFIQIKLWAVQVAELVSAIWSMKLADIREKFGKLGEVAAIVLRGIGTFAKVVVNAFIGMFVGAFRLITGLWENFPAMMHNLFAMVVNAAQWAAEQVLNVWQAPLRGIAKGMELMGADASGLVGWLDSATVSFERMESKATNMGEVMSSVADAITYDYAGTALNAVENAFSSIVNTLGAMGRDREGSEGAVSTESTEAMANATKEASEADKEAAAERQKAIQALKDRIKETKDATAEQLRMNDAVRQGPAAVRALNVQLAYERELREQLKALDEAGVSIAEGSEGRALAIAAAEAMKNGELAKQAEALANLDFQLGRNIEKMREQIDVSRRSLDIAFEMDAVRQRELIWADEYQTKLEELIQGYTEAEYGTEEYAEAMKRATAAAREFADAQQMLRDSSTALGLLQSMMTDTERMQIGYDNARLALERFIYSAAGVKTPAEDIERMREGLERLRPPENVFDALKMGLRDYMDEIRPSLLQVQELGEKAFNGIGDALADLVLTGKANFGELARSIIADLTRMIIKALIFKAISSFFGGGAPSYAATPFSFLNTAPLGNATPISLNHTGGIVGAAGATRKAFPGAWAAAKKYHSGGLAGQGSLPGEIPVIAKRNEAILPTVRLPDGNFGVKADVGRGGGVYAPQFNMHFNGSGGREGPQSPADLPPELQKKFGQMMEEELNIHMQRKFEEWVRPGGQLSMAVKRR